MGVLMNLDGFKLKDVQTFLQLCQIAEAEGITDLRFVRQQLQRHIDRQFVVAIATKVKGKRTGNMPPEIKAELCPSCGRKSLVPAAPLEGLQRVGCKPCGYSAVIGEVR